MNAWWTSPRPQTVKASCFGLGRAECAEVIHAYGLTSVFFLFSFFFMASKINFSAFAIAMHRPCAVLFGRFHARSSVFIIKGVTNEENKQPVTFLTF